MRLTHRAVFIAEKLAGKYGKPLSAIFSRASDLKRAYQFNAYQKTSSQRCREKSGDGVGGGTTKRDIPA